LESLPQLNSTIRRSPMPKTREMLFCITPKMIN